MGRPWDGMVKPEEDGRSQRRPMTQQFTLDCSALAVPQRSAEADQAFGDFFEGLLAAAGGLPAGFAGVAGAAFVVLRFMAQ